MCLDRRFFLKSTSVAAALAALPGMSPVAAETIGETNFGFGLVTYMWGAKMDLPTLIKNCETAGMQAVELRTTHAHGVEPSLNEAERKEVQKRFSDTPVVCVGLGSDERFDNPDPAVVRKAIERAKEFIRLSHDIGASGVKVKPDSFKKDVPHEKTIEQIGKSLNELGEYAAGFGQQVRLEVHGECAELPTIKAILDIATDDNVAICWNSNVTDLKGDEKDPTANLRHNFNLVRKRFGATLHVREVTGKDYPWQELVNLLVKTDYEGYVLLEAASEQSDYVAAMTEQVKAFKALVAKAKG
jgi:sugar phosphate isomerase/epimerase